MSIIDEFIVQIAESIIQIMLYSAGAIWYTLFIETTQERGKFEWIQAFFSACAGGRRGVVNTMKKNYGFIYGKLEIKILILFILRRLPEPISFDTLTELTICDEGISYFYYAECIEELVKTEHVRFKDNMYSVTEKGVRNGGILEDSLPFTVRMIAGNTTSALRATMDRDAMIKTSHATNPEGGCMVKLAMSDGVGDIISMEMFAANEQQASELESGFRKNAESIYNALVEMMLD